MQNELALIWGVEPLGHMPCDSTEQMVKTGERALLEAGIVQQGEMIVLMAGKLSGLGLSRSVKLHEIGDATGNSKSRIQNPEFRSQKKRKSEEGLQPYHSGF